MSFGRLILFLSLGASLIAGSVSAVERFFMYTYEPETSPKGLLEYEQWVTLRAGRNSAVGQEQYHRWELRQEFEYGVTDNYTVSFYLNESLTNFREAETGRHNSHLQFDGVSLENRYMWWNPADHAVGLAFYLEPTIAAHQAELEQKLILGQRYGDWKWALNLTHATEWRNDFHNHEGELELSLGLTYQLNSRWNIGLEARDHNEIPEYRVWENTAVYLGPVVTYKSERWWLTLAVMPQILGANFAANVDRDHSFELEGHERLNVRLAGGFSF